MRIRVYYGNTIVFCADRHDLVEEEQSRRQRQRRKARNLDERVETPDNITLHTDEGVLT
jgi:hypothetical protein